MKNSLLRKICKESHGRYFIFLTKKAYWYQKKINKKTKQQNTPKKKPKPIKKQTKTLLK